MQWQSISNLPETQASCIERRLHSILTSWENTPYSESGDRKGAGINCVRWVCAMADELYGYSRGALSNLPADRCLHDPTGARRVMRAIRRRYLPLRNVLPGEALEPGDILVVGPTDGGPGHAMMIGAYPGHVWHCDRSGVHRTALPDFGPKTKLFRNYRVLNKAMWYR